MSQIRNTPKKIRFRGDLKFHFTHESKIEDIPDEEYLDFTNYENEVKSKGK